MAKVPNPPQFDAKYDKEKIRRFVEDMIRAFNELNGEVAALGGGGGSAASRAYPPQLGHARI